MYGMQCCNNKRYTYKQTNIAERKKTLLMIWNDLLQEFIDIMATVSFLNRLPLCVSEAGGYSKHC